MKAKKFCLLGVISLMLAVGFSTAQLPKYVSSVIYNEGPDPRGAIISGHVYQVNGQPISGATIQVIRMDAEGERETTTLSDGSYRVTGLHPGDYKVRAFKQGFAREYYDNVFYSNQATIIHVTTTEEITGIDLILTEGGSISGYVYNNETGEPIEGADILVCPSKYVSDDGFWAITDPNGNYIVEGLTLGIYKIWAGGLPAYIPKFYDGVYHWNEATNVKVTPPEIKSNINISLELGGSISGFIWASDGITPIPRVGVIAGPIKHGFQGAGAESIEDGSYTIGGLAPGDYTVRTGEDMPNWYAGEFYNSELSRQTADKVTVTAGNDTSNINFTLEEGGWLTGHVFDEQTGEPISGVQLDAHAPEGDFVTPAPWTFYDGSYKFVLREGDYLIRAGIGIDQAHGYSYVSEWYDNSYDMDNATVVSVVIHQETSGIDFYLSKAGSISGYIYSDTGEPISDASVYAFSDIYPGSGANSQSDGCYVIEGLPSGIYSVQIYVTGYISESITDVIVNAPSDTSGINFTLKKIIPADFDMDLHVDFVDYAVLANHWMNQNCNEPDWCDGTDLDKDGSLNWLDLAQFTENWLAGAQ